MTVETAPDVFEAPEVPPVPPVPPVPELPPLPPPPPAPPPKMVVDPTVVVKVDEPLVTTDSMAEVVIADEEPPEPVPWNR